jgi:hypothetical protein
MDFGCAGKSKTLHKIFISSVSKRDEKDAFWIYVTPI